MSEIGLEEYINCVLVNTDVRPAFLIQPADYREATSNDPKTRAIVSAIRRTFPDLIVSSVAIMATASLNRNFLIRAKLRMNTMLTGRLHVG